MSSLIFKHSTLYGVGEVQMGESEPEIIEYLDGLGDVGEYFGDVGE